jgi:uncharacterized membrane protein YkgB
MGIAPLVSNSPLTSWLSVLGTQGASMVIGISELTFGVLLAIGLRWPDSLAATLGAFGSCMTFLTTLSFMVTTPGVWAPSGPPLLSGNTGVFLIKDIVLLATSTLLLAQALSYRRAMAWALAAHVSQVVVKPRRLSWRHRSGDLALALQAAQRAG